MLSFKGCLTAGHFDVTTAERDSIALPKLRKNEKKLMRPGLSDTTAGKDHCDCSPAWNLLLIRARSSRSSCSVIPRSGEI
jgi:hypothetical protein